MKMKFAGLILAGIILMIACQKKEEIVHNGKGLPVVLEPVQDQSLAKPVVTSGTLTSAADLKLSFKIGGIINGFEVKEGEKVKKGQVLASLKLDEIAAKVAQAQSGFEKAQRDYQRAQNLYGDSVATLEQLQDAKTGMDVAKANLEIATFNLDHAKITAPDDGRVLKQLAEANEMIGSGHPIFMFASGDNEWMIKSGVSDRDVVRLHIHDKAHVTFNVLPDLSFDAKVTEIAGGPSPMNGTYEVRLALDRADQQLFNGFVANVTIYPSIEEQLQVIPFDALVDVQGMKGFVFTVTSDSVARKIPVKINFLFNQFAAIQTGLENVAQVVTEGSAYLIDGQPVQVVQK